MAIYPILQIWQIKTEKTARHHSRPSLDFRLNARSSAQPMYHVKQLNHQSRKIPIISILKGNRLSVLCFLQ